MYSYIQGVRECQKAVKPCTEGYLGRPRRPAAGRVRYPPGPRPPAGSPLRRRDRTQPAPSGIPRRPRGGRLELTGSRARLEQASALGPGPGRPGGRPSSSTAGRARAGAPTTPRAPTTPHRRAPRHHQRPRRHPLTTHHRHPHPPEVEVPPPPRRDPGRPSAISGPEIFGGWEPLSEAAGLLALGEGANGGRRVVLLGVRVPGCGGSRVPHMPRFQSFMLPLLELVGDGGTHRLREAVDALANGLAITDDDRQELVPSGTQTRLYNRVVWARTYMTKAGLLECPQRGLFPDHRPRPAGSLREAVYDRRRVPQTVRGVRSLA